MPDSNQDPKPSPPLDREAKGRLAVIRHVEEVTGNLAQPCRYFGITRQRPPGLAQTYRHPQ